MEYIGLREKKGGIISLMDICMPKKEVSIIYSTNNINLK